MPEDHNITAPGFTNLALGEGLVDQLMATVNHHIDLQYKQNRLKGSDFAQVYVGSINSVMQFSTQYLLGTLLIDEQKGKLTAETSLTVKQEEEIEMRIGILELEQEKLRFEIDQLFPLQVLKTQAEIDLINAQILKINEEVDHMIAQQALWVKQGLKLDKEIAFMTAKIVTETANTSAGIADAGSLIGRQMSLLAAQKLGFAGDLQIKLAKVYADYDAVFQSVQEVPEDATLHPQAVSSLGAAVTTANAIKAA